MIISSCTPVMGGVETAIEDLESPILMDAGDYDLDVAYQGEAIKDSVAEIPSSVDLAQESNTPATTNYYFGSVYINDEGIWDADPSSNQVTAKRITVPGLTFDSDTCTLTLDNLSIGAIVDDFICPDKGGSLDISIGDPGKQLTISMNGRNFIGGYSTRLRQGFNSEGCDSTESFHAYTSGSSVMKIEGDGELQVIGLVNIGYMREIESSKPVWYSYYYDGRNIKQYTSPYYDPNTGMTGGIHGRYLKIGGDKPDKPDTPEAYITGEKNLGVIGGHTVSVCFTDNIPFQAAKILNQTGYDVVYNSLTNDYEFYPYNPRF